MICNEDPDVQIKWSESEKRFDIGQPINANPHC